MWHFESENDRKLLKRSAVNEASATLLKTCGTMFVDYSAEEFAHAVDFLKECKTDFIKQIDETIKVYKEKSEKKEG